MLADRRGGVVDVGHGRHLLALELEANESRLNGLLDLGDGTLVGHEFPLWCERRIRCH
ncbi:hypothetical protein [Streptomyces chartreusis]|uniref:hypothetical protein n=1 Tax=Streptomyces chartreusis TaxID=1969 RepID=UPI0035DC0C3D